MFHLLINKQCSNYFTTNKDPIAQQSITNVIYDNI